MSQPHEIATFVRVVDRGSFVAAATDLSLTPSAVSKIISRLEGRLGVQLLTRTTRRLALTVEGETYLGRCREILAAIEQAESEVTYSGGRLRGFIKVNAGTALGRHYLVRLVPEFLEDHPALEIEISITDRRIDVIGENVDIALRAGQLSDSSLMSRKVAETGRVVCASPKYLEKHGIPEKPTDLEGHNCIRVAGFSHLSQWPFLIDGEVVRTEVSGSIVTDDADAMLDLAIAGHGVVRMTDIHAAEAIRSGQLVVILEHCHVTETIPIWALMPPGRNRVPRVRLFLDFLIDKLGAGPWSFGENPPVKEVI